MNNIKFVKNNENNYNPDKRIDTFYQICKFKNPYTKLHELRKIFFDETGDILKISIKSYDANTIKSFIKCHNLNKYKIYPVIYIEHVDLPNKNDMTEVRSDLLNNTEKEYGNQKV